MEKVSIKLTQTEFISMVELMRNLVETNVFSKALKNNEIGEKLLEIVYTKLLYKLEKKLIPIQKKYKLNLQPEEAIAVYLVFLVLGDELNCEYNKNIVRKIINTTHQKMII